MKNIKLTVPESWNDITVRQYQKFTKILKLQQEERQRTIDIVSVFCNVDKKLLKWKRTLSLTVTNMVLFQICLK